MVLNSEERNAMVLNKSQAFWRSTIDSPAYREWFEIAIKCEKFYNGDPWNEIQSQSEKNLKINLIAGYIHSLVGEQLKTRTSVSVRSHELLSNPEQLPSVVGLTDEEYKQAIMAYNSSLYREYELNSIPYYQSQSMKDTLVYGMGAAFFDIVNGERKYSRLNPLYVVPDLMDETVGFDDSEFIGQLIPMSIKQALKLFQKISEIVGKYSENAYVTNYISPRNVMLDGMTQTADGRAVFIKMMEWKVWETSYTGLAKNGRTFTVFDEEIAEKNAVSKKDIREGQHERIHRSFFCGDTLLKYECLEMSLPREQFSIITSCLLKKASKDGFYIPKSLVEDLLDLQREFVIRQSKSLFLSDSKKIAIDPDAVDNFQKSSIDQIKTEVASSSTVLFIKEPSRNLVDFSLANDIRTSMGLAEEYMKLFDQVTGINREQRGMPTNAQTGIAIRERQMQGITSNIYAFNEFNMFKKKVGRLFVQTMQMEMLGIEDVFMPSHPTKSGNIILNYKAKNSKKLIRDVNFLPLEIYIEESPEFLSSKDEQREILGNLLQSPYAMIFLMSPALRKSIGLYLDDSVAQEVLQGMQAQAQMSQGGADQQQANQSQPNQQMMAISGA